ncbi:MAG: purine-nucleoside phosphorylase [Verrucomicrobiota bacterium]
MKEFLESKLTGFKPEVALIVGSGLGGVTAALTKPVTIPYTDIPGFPQPRVAGHAGKLLAGELGGKRLLIFSGRFHHYEGRPVSELVAPVKVAAALGAKTLIVTNAAGGINPTFNPGDLMIIDDHINLMGINPLIGEPTFIDMTQAYSLRLREKLATAGGPSIRRGVYLATAGPSYETPAEIRAFGRLGADAVGMSTVPEVIMARYQNIEVAGLSCITNLAAGISGKKLSHAEVLEVGQASQAKLAKLLTEFLGLL